MRFSNLTSVVLFISVLTSGCSEPSHNFLGAENNLEEDKPKPEPEATFKPKIVVLSNRADMLSAGDALVEVMSSAEQPIRSLSVKLNGVDVSDKIALRSNKRWMGRIAGMKVGDNLLSVRVNNSFDAERVLRNFPNEGPIFAGPQVPRLHCQEAGDPVTCNKLAEYTFLYKSSSSNNSGLQPYDVKSPPDDVATTTTDNGVTVPFIVRQELGYQDRDQYRILTLFNPTAGWEPWAPQPQWNHKVLVTHGGGCGTSFSPSEALLNDFSGTFNDIPILEQSYVTSLSRGFAVMSTALNNGNHNCDMALQAESLIMAKEHLVENYGEIRYTIGTGCSGGSITQLTVANAYPGIYQGLITMCTYPDVMSAGLQFADLHLMRNYFEGTNSLMRGISWVPTQWGDVEGHLTHLNAVIATEGLFKNATNPEGGCYGQNSYHSQNNPKGQRCGIIDAFTHFVGFREEPLWSSMEKSAGRGFAHIPLGNTGVQYGLKPFQQGRITAQQFADLNIYIGGLDIDIKPTIERTRADSMAIHNLYRGGMLNVTNNLNTVPILNFSGSDPGAAHDAVHAWWVRWRLDREHGHHDNHVMWVGAVPLIGDVNWVHEGLGAMDKWLSAIEKDNSLRPISEKLIANKPADLQDRCIMPTGLAAVGKACVDVFRLAYAYGTPRTQAGDDIYGDNLDCKLKPYNPTTEYGPLLPNLFLPGQLDALSKVFKDGVCDYSKPSFNIVPTETWLSYLDSQGQRVIGGHKLPPIPSFSGMGLQSASFNYERMSTP